MANPAGRAVSGYLWGALVAVDQLGNALSGGHPGETISYRVAVAARKGTRFGCAFCKVLDLFQTNHCAITLASRDTNRTVGS